MTRLIPTLILALVLPASAFASLKADSPLDDVLDALHAVGKDLKSFSANVTLRETDLISQDASSRSGMTVFEQNPGGDARLRVTFLKRIQDNMTQDQRIEYLLERGWLIERNYPRKLEIRRQVSAPGERVNLLRLGEGPFPLPIGQSKEEVKRLFTVTRPEKPAASVPNTTHLRLAPRPNTQFERRFTTIDVWVDLQSHMPIRIDTIDANDTLMRGTDLTDVRLNVPLTAEHFELPAIPNDWQRREERFE